MPLNFTYVPEVDFSQGIDQFSAEAQVQPGFVEDALNCDIKERRLVKRPGYQTYSGSLPMRVESLTYEAATDIMFLQLNNALDLSVIRNIPIVVYGKTILNANGGDFNSTDSGHYYANINTDPRKQLGGVDTTIDDHGYQHTNFLVGVTESTDLSSYNNTIHWMDKTLHDKVSYAVTLQHTLTPDPLSAFVYYKEAVALAGSVHVETNTGILSVGTVSYTITAGTHALNNYNIFVQLHRDNGTSWETVKPDSVVIHTNGNVDITLTVNDSAIAVGELRTTLLSFPTANTQQGAFAAGTNTLTITGQTSPFIFAACYLEDLGTGDLTQVDINSASYDAVTSTYSFEIIAGISTNFVVYYDFGTVQTNVLQVTSSVDITVDGEDDSPQMTVWGLPHYATGIYGANKIAREGWCNHIDAYRSQGESHLVAGLGGNLFAALDRTAISANYKLPLLYTNLRNRIGTDTKIGPLFRGASETFARSRGYINAANTSSNWATITAVTYMTAGPNSGLLRYTLKVTGKQIKDSTGAATTLAAVISTTASLEDHVTIQQCGKSFHNGTFAIRAVEDIDANTIALYISPSETQYATSDYDEVDVGGLAGVFTDQLPMDTDNYFIPGDILLADLFSADDLYTITGSSNALSVIDGVISSLSVPAGLRVFGRRTSSIIPLRNSLSVASATDFVTGDSIAYSAVDRLLHCNYVNAQADIAVSIVGDGSEATLTLTGNTKHLAIGQKILLRSSGSYTGIHLIKDIPSLTTIVIDSTETASVSGYLVGNHLEVDEELEWYDAKSDTLFLEVQKRWIPIESPTDSITATPNFTVRHFDNDLYTDQSFIRSCMVNDNMYLTNGSDEVLKYDGTSLYRAGLPRWQPGLFIVKQEGASAKIVVSSLSVTGTVSGNEFICSAGDEESFSVGNEVQIGTGTHTILDINTVTHKVRVSGSPSGTTMALLSHLYRYYFRLNAVDANNNIVASAATGNEDFSVNLSVSAAIQLKLVGFPVWDNYDYDRLEVEIYRTKANTAAPFYKLATVPLKFEKEEGYIIYTDTAPDEALHQLDVVNTGLLGQELGVGWEEPLRAKYLTTANNSLVLANVRDYPQLDMVIDGSSANNAGLNGKIFSFERQTNSVAPTVTDNSLVQRYEFRNTGDQAVTVAWLNTSYFQVTFTDPPTTAPVAGDWIYLFRKGTLPTNLNLEPTGYWQIESGSGSVYQIRHKSTSTFLGDLPTSALLATDPTDIPVYLNDSTPSNADACLGMSGGQPVSVSDEKNVAMNRLANAINCVQRKCSETAGFTAWMTAHSDGSYGQGQLIVRQPKHEGTALHVRLPSSMTFDCYVNGVGYPAASNVPSQELYFPSRVLMSYPNYPEMFDNPVTILPQNSDSVIDVNPADGQEITGLIPFFGDSAFGGSFKGGVVVCFKENSIYLLDLPAKVRGDNTNVVQKLESRGLGCTAPYSIASTKDGIMFANESGIYRLNRDLSVEYIGKYMERNWLEKVDRDQLSICHGHHYSIGKIYKLSVPVGTTDVPNEVYCYHHSGEQEQGGRGGWTRYDSHNAAGWANLNSDAFWCDTAGRVFSIRRNGSDTDFRDSSQAITAEITSRALDFGAPGIRKVFAAILAHYRSTAHVENTQLTYSYDLQEEFRVTDTLVVSRREQDTGVDDSINQKGKTIKSVLDRRKAVYFQVRFTNNGKDEPLDVAGYTVKVAGLTDQGILQARNTRR